MPFKYDATGNIVTQDVNGAKLPVFINAEGKESAFDGDATVKTISTLNFEAKTHRERAEKAESTLKTFEGIADPKAALAALQTVKDLKDGDLVKAGEVQKVRDEISKTFQAQLEELKKANEGLTTSLYDMTVGTAFAQSAFVKEKLAVPSDFVQAKFGNNFGVENGKVYAVDGNGQKIYSRKPETAGQLAEFDEALSILVDGYQHKSSILKGNGAAGGGAQGGGSSGKATLTRAEFDSLDPSAKAEAARSKTIVD